MKSGGPWNLRGLNPETREVARDAARQSGMSVGEWLNNVIQPSDPQPSYPQPGYADDDERPRFADDESPRDAGYHNAGQRNAGKRNGGRRDDGGGDDRPWRHRDDDESRPHDEPHRASRRRRGRERDYTAEAIPNAVRRERQDREAERREAERRENERRQRDNESRDRARQQHERQEHERQLRERERETVMARELRERERERETAMAREEFGEVHARLDQLTQQLDRMVRGGPPKLGGSPSPQRLHQPLTGRPNPLNRPTALGRLSVDDAVSQIAERQRELRGRPVAPPPEPMPAMPPSVSASPLAIPEPLVLATPAASMVPAASAPTGGPVFVTSAPIAPVFAAPEFASAAPVVAAATAPQSLEIPAIFKVAEPPVVDISGLEAQLRDITARIETLRPSNELERIITAFRQDLAEISHRLTEALPRHAVESLEIEVQALAQRIDHSRQTGIDTNSLAGLEHGLAEVRDALRGLTPAENLVGFDDAVKSLSQKVDLLLTKEDPATLQQLETAIGALRGIVSHVASNDTLTKVAEDVRSLAAKVDDFANRAASGVAVSQLESRIDTLANALSASTEAGNAIPRELEKLLTGLVEKLEALQLTQTDHAAVVHLEDRIAQLIKRLDVSDARLGNLGAIERGLADLLVHIDQIRGGNADAVTRGDRRAPRALEDSLEAVHGTVEHVVDRLAMIESGLHEAAPAVGKFAASAEAPVMVPPSPAPSARVPSEAPEPRAATPVLSPASMPAPAAADPAARRAAAPRQPIDPNLPPDHPLEPGSTPGSRAAPSAADRIAASEAAAGYAKAPAIPESSEKPNFIAAARRAAQAAAAGEPERKPRTEIKGLDDDATSTPRLRKFLVAGGVLLIVFGCVHIAMHMFQDTSAPAVPPPVEQTSPPEAAPGSTPDSDPARQMPPSGPLVLPVPGAPLDTTPDQSPSLAPNPVPNNSQNTVPGSVRGQNSIAAPAIVPIAPAAAAPPAMPTAPAVPSRQSSLQDPTDVTGSIPRHMPPAAAPVAAAPIQATAPAAAIEKLPATIGGPTLRAAALAGDAAAEFEIATRYADGHDVPPNNEQAARWLDRAAKQGLAPAQFRLGGFYEKGIGVKKDLAMARDLYTAAAAKGNGKAMHNLAVLYAEGINGAGDYRTAAHWFHKAADYGVADSQYNLAVLYARGIGVDQNYPESYKWFTLAATQGDNEAAKKRDEVASHLDPQTLAAAQLAVQKWTAEPQPDDAINVKSPPGGWDQAAKPKVRVIGAKAAAPDAKVN